MKSLCVFLFMLFGLYPPLPAQTNYYIRVDGGTRYSAANPTGQCDGKTNAAYPGSGVNQHCAWNDVGYLAYDGSYATTPKYAIAGGDVVHVGPGKFRCGYRGPNPNDHDGMALAGNPYAACFPSLPAGTAANPTQIIGAGQGQTQIYGGYAAGAIFELHGGYYAISGLELTDHSQCTRVGIATCSSGYPLDDYASNGITTDTSVLGLTLTDMNIHGFTSRGIIGPIGGPVMVSNVRVAFNGSAGWDFDDGHGTQSVNGTVKAVGLVVEGNGCNEEYPIVHQAFPAASCFDQDHAGYGDGVGTPGTPLNFSCDQCTFRYNTQDGADLLHVTGSVISITNSTSYGNMGQQWKFGAMKSVDFENNTTVHNCKRLSAPMPGRIDTFPGLGLFCRAAGDGIAFLVMDGGSYTFRHNSYVGYGATSYDIGCNVQPCTQANIVYEDNINLGYPSPLDGQLPGVFYWPNDPTKPGGFAVASPILTADHNIYYRMRSTPTDGVSVDPQFVGEPVWTGQEASLDNFNFTLSPSSPAIAMGAGASISPISVTPPVVTPPVTSPPPVTQPPVTTPPPATHTVTMMITVDGKPVTLTGSY